MNLQTQMQNGISFSNIAAVRLLAPLALTLLAACGGGGGGGGGTPDAGAPSPIAASALSKSSGGDSFELFGTLSCSTYPSACTINGGANAVTTNPAAAVWEKGAYAANSYVEAKGVLDKAGVFQVAKVKH